MTTELDPTDFFGPGSPCFGCSQEHPIGFHMRFVQEGDEIVTRMVPGDRYQGPLGIMHGGLVTTFADEVADWAIIAKLGRFGFTAAIDARFKKPIRVGVELEGRARIAEDRKRIVKVTVRLLQAGEEVYTGTFTFVLVDEAGAERMRGGPLPERWKRFCR